MPCLSNEKRSIGSEVKESTKIYKEYSIVSKQGIWSLMGHLEEGAILLKSGCQSGFIWLILHKSIFLFFLFFSSSQSLTILHIECEPDNVSIALFFILLCLYIPITQA